MFTWVRLSAIDFNLKFESLHVKQLIVARMETLGYIGSNALLCQINGVSTIGGLHYKKSCKPLLPLIKVCASESKAPL